MIILIDHWPGELPDLWLAEKWGSPPKYWPVATKFLHVAYQAWEHPENSVQKVGKLGLLPETLQKKVRFLNSTSVIRTICLQNHLEKKMPRIMKLTRRLRNKATAELGFRPVVHLPTDDGEIAVQRRLGSAHWLRRQEKPWGVSIQLRIWLCFIFIKNGYLFWTRLDICLHNKPIYQPPAVKTTEFHHVPFASICYNML